MATSSDAASAGMAGAGAVASSTEISKAETASTETCGATADKTLIFLHVPKAAGTTMASILTAQYGKQASYHTKRQAHQQIEAMPEAQRRQLRLIHGHMPFGIHQYLSQPWTYFTMLRHPVDRVISHYYYILNSPDHAGYPIAKAARNLNDYINCGLQEQTNNVQTRHLSGVGGTVRFGQCTTAHLGQAKRNLEEVFILAGTSEQFDATLLLLGQRLGWTPSPYPKLNVNPRRRKRDELSRQTIATIERYNALDLELYRYVSDRLQAQIEAQGPEFQATLAAFQQANLDYGAASQDSVQIQPTVGVSQRRAAQAATVPEAASEPEQLRGQLAAARQQIQALETLQDRTQKQLRRSVTKLARLRGEATRPPLSARIWRRHLRPLVARLTPGRSPK